MSLLFTVGLLMSLPWLARIFYMLGRIIVLYVVPTTTVTLTDENGRERVIKLKNTDELADVILSRTGHLKRD
ncbi:hypothetical protein [Vibrio parahaemolyticus]|uniref:hypothetical protein n=1 Tax=Vibrio parahaemolyticus TaxID=670 RepID=UPI001112EEF1|nr:hypothetical protein [Vibrio parahaemolyticus]EJE8518658.1 hypothetical protein [Vibrio parahaemolyticus]HCH5747665.1 hypothetical protein [Vibrio parahaemolyticus]